MANNRNIQATLFYTSIYKNISENYITFPSISSFSMQIESLYVKCVLRLQVINSLMIKTIPQKFCFSAQVFLNIFWILQIYY